MIRIYVVVIFDYDGKYDSVKLFRSASEATECANSIHAIGGEFELFYKYVK